jgi:hypothetical protein
MNNTTTATKRHSNKLLAEVTTALDAAMTAPFTPARASGCGRAYVCLGRSNDRALVAAVKAACKARGLIFTPKGYGVGSNAIYVGYDNADGRALGRAKAISDVLNAHGISAYDDAACD